MNYVHIVTMGAVKPVTHSSKDRVVWITPKICGLVQKFGKKGSNRKTEIQNHKNFVFKNFQRFFFDAFIEWNALVIIS